MKRFALVGIMVALAAVAIVGCNWETGSDAETWSDVYGWVDFNGTYFGMFTNNVAVAEAGIKSFSVAHRGQHIQLWDDRGGSYSGTIRSMRSISGMGPSIANTNTMDMPLDGDQIVAAFDATGRSGARRPVQIVGTLEGFVTARVFNSRRLFGTYMETGASDGAIAGAAASVQITSVTVTNAPPAEE